MSVKRVAQDSKGESYKLEVVVVVIREYDEERDKEDVEKMEMQCEFGQQQGKPSLITHLLGDPLGRIRHFPTRIMMVIITNYTLYSYTLAS